MAVPSFHAGMFSGSWLIDQLIKHYRRTVFPGQLYRTMKMNYGADGLGFESKKLFTRNDLRQDYYCLSLPVTLPPPFTPTCSEAVCLSGTEMYDFSDPHTRYKLIAYGGASYSRSLGGHDASQHLKPNSGFLNWRTNEVDLADPNTYGYGKYVMWHGAQFRGMLADQRPYWELFLSHIGSTTP